MAADMLPNPREAGVPTTAVFVVTPCPFVVREALRWLDACVLFVFSLFEGLLHVVAIEAPVPRVHLYEVCT